MCRVCLDSSSRNGGGSEGFDRLLDEARRDQRVTAWRAAVRVTAISQDFQYKTAAPHRCASQPCLASQNLHIARINYTIVSQPNSRTYKTGCGVTKDAHHGKEPRNFKREHE
jgi:hypothetical protein